MLSKNPLCLLILRILNNANTVVGLYDLMCDIENEGYSIVEDDELVSNELKLYRKNFIVMNSLYQLQKEMKEQGYYLYISSLKILLVPLASSHSTDLAADLDVDEQAEMAMSEYYLDWSNFDMTGQQEVESLLSNFWRQYTEYTHCYDDEDKRSWYLDVLGLKSDASWEHIQLAYRQKAALYHPDKGGTGQQFIEIREAFEFLKLTQTQ